MEQMIRYSTPLIAIVMIVVQRWEKKKIVDFPKAETKKEKEYLAIQSIVLIICSIYLAMCYEPTDIFSGWKVICILGLMGLIAYVDYKIQLIPNEFLKMAFIIRIVVLILEVFLDFSTGIANLISECIGCIVLLIFGLILRIISRNGFGMGDIKLLSVLPLFLGIVGCMEATFYSMIIIFIQACVCLIVGKKNKTDELPFAPAVLGGVFIWTIGLGV